MATGAAAHGSMSNSVRHRKGTPARLATQRPIVGRNSAVLVALERWREGMFLVAVHSVSPILPFLPLVDVQPKEQQNAKDDRRNCH